MRIISIDPATKSIALCCMDLIDKDGFMLNTDSLTNKIKMVGVNAVDLAPGTKNDDIPILERVKLANEYVKKHIKPLIEDKNNTVILIEQQIQTTKTFVPYITLISMLADYKIVIIKPALKNQLSLGGHMIGHFYKNYTQKYIANKEHCRAMFKWYQLLLDYKLTYPFKFERDIADAFAQIMVYASKN